MSKILNDNDVRLYFEEAMKYPRIIDELNNYEKSKVLAYCEQVIYDRAKSVAMIKMANEGKPNSEHNMRIVENAFLGEYRRVQHFIKNNLGINSDNQMEAPKPVLNYYFNEVKPEKQIELIKRYSGSGLTEIYTMLKYLESIDLFKPDFFRIKHNDLLVMLRESFDLKGGTPNGVSTIKGKFDDSIESKNRLREVAPKIKAILEE